MDARFDLNGVAFIWDPAKALRNQRKHGIRFEQAAEAFFDPFLRLVEAERNQEPRDGNRLRRAGPALVRSSPGDGERVHPYRFRKEGHNRRAPNL